jgi:DNA polymerase II small subunit
MLEIVQRFAERGYQLDPQALELIKSHPAREEIIKHLLGSIDRTVAVIDASHVSSLTSLASSSILANEHKSSINPSFLDGKSLLSRNSQIPSTSEPERPGLSRHGVEVCCDITGHSTCIGEYDDFLRYFRDRYTKLREILAGRLSARPIESIGKSTTGREISLIGMVMDVKSTSKGNRIVELEDPTGMITAVIQKDTEIFDQSSFILPDEVIGVTGTSDGNGRIFVKYVTWPDMPNQSEPLEKGSGCVLLLSDLHVGSKFFMKEAWQRFISWVNGEVDDPSGLASQVEYIVVAGDVVDGIGVYPDQEADLAVKDIFEQYQEAANCLNSIRQGISVIIAPGNHDIVRQAEPQPALPEVVQKFFRSDFVFVGSPAWIRLGGVPLLVYHGRSLDDLVLRVPGLSYSSPEKAMVEMLKRRHLSPVYGSRVSIAPEHEDHYVISRSPSILHCGHVHTVGIARYKGVVAINSGTWQSQTEFQKKMNVNPTPATVPIVDLATMRVRKLLFA